MAYEQMKRDAQADDHINSIEKARQLFNDAATECGSDPITEENAILQAGREFLPECAIAVLDGGESTVEYWEWLTEQTREAQAQYNAEIAAEHEWHE